MFIVTAATEEQSSVGAACSSWRQTSSRMLLPTELKEFMKGRRAYKYGAPLELNLMSGRASVKFRVSRQNAR